MKIQRLVDLKTAVEKTRQNKQTKPARPTCQRRFLTGTGTYVVTAMEEELAVLVPPYPFSPSNGRDADVPQSSHPDHKLMNDRQGSGVKNDNH